MEDAVEQTRRKSKREPRMRLERKRISQRAWSRSSLDCSGLKSSEKCKVEEAAERDAFKKGRQNWNGWLAGAAVREAIFA